MSRNSKVLRICTGLLLFWFIFSPVAQAKTYTYDNLNRLTTVDYGNGYIIQYTYDATGNITSVQTIGGDTEEYNPWPPKTNVELWHPWTITFSQVVDPTSINAESIYIIDESGEDRVPLDQPDISLDKKTVIIKQTRSYYPSCQYYLVITSKVKSEQGKSLKPVKMPFTIQSGQ